VQILRLLKSHGVTVSAARRSEEVR
jgi:hypothetical protein